LEGIGRRLAREEGALEPQRDLPSDLVGTFDGDEFGVAPGPERRIGVGRRAREADPLGDVGEIGGDHADGVGAASDGPAAAQVGVGVQRGEQPLRRRRAGVFGQRPGE